MASHSVVRARGRPDLHLKPGLAPSRQLTQSHSHHMFVRIAKVVWSKCSFVYLNHTLTAQRESRARRENIGSAIVESISQFIQTGQYER